jgi:hypothetical protein
MSNSNSGDDSRSYDDQLQRCEDFGVRVLFSRFGEMWREKSVVHDRVCDCALSYDLYLCRMLLMGTQRLMGKSLYTRVVGAKRDPEFLEIFIETVDR